METNDPITRRALGLTLLGTALTAGTAIAQPPAPAQSQPPEEPRDYPAPEFKPKFKKPKLGITLAHDFVIYAHFDLKMVKRLLDKEPAILNATVDWGGGDWECGLGGASHLGNREIANYLLERGARPDIFTATMLGHLDVVKTLLTAHPLLANAKGPHGIPLIAHAKAGGKEAEETLKFLTDLKRV